MNVSAVILNWKRPHNLPTIIDSLLAVPRIKEIVVWDNSSRLEPSPDGRVRVFRSQSNICTLGRFKAIQEASHDSIFTQDDDVRVDDVDAILDLYENRQDSIVASLTQGHMNAEAGKKPWVQLGWGSAFSAHAADVLGYYIDVYGEDDVLQRKADRIFTILHGKHIYRAADVTPLLDPDGRKSESSRDALYKMMDHHKLTAIAAKRALEIRGSASA